jgi:hypothetical protein
MGSFLNKLSELFAKITGASAEDSIHPPEQPQKPVEQAFSAPGKFTFAAKSPKKERESYFFQIGFDFGTSSSKAIIRDINKDRAWVYTVPGPVNTSAFLIPSVVIYKNAQFERHINPNTLYPEGGIVSPQNGP